MVSSPIACVNFLLPLVEIPGALSAVLQATYDDGTGIVNFKHQGTFSPVAIERIGLDHSLEGRSHIRPAPPAPSTATAPR